jgi:hypothetical protein
LSGRPRRGRRGDGSGRLRVRRVACPRRSDRSGGGDPTRRLNQSVFEGGATRWPLPAAGCRHPRRWSDHCSEDPRPHWRRHPLPSSGHFASYTGTAPLDASSGQRIPHRLNTGGNRQLNATLHTIAVCQARDPGPGRTYHLRKLGKSKTERGPSRAETSPGQRDLPSADQRSTTKPPPSCAPGSEPTEALRREPLTRTRPPRIGGDRFGGDRTRQPRWPVSLLLDELATTAGKSG